MQRNVLTVPKNILALMVVNCETNKVIQIFSLSLNQNVWIQCFAFSGLIQVFWTCVLSYLEWWKGHNLCHYSLWNQWSCQYRSILLISVCPLTKPHYRRNNKQEAKDDVFFSSTSLISPCVYGLKNRLRRSALLFCWSLWPSVVCGQKRFWPADVLVIRMDKEWGHGFG